MDASQYHPNGLNTSNSPYSSLPGISMHQLQHHSNLSPHTLPPLQPQHTVMPMYNSAPHTPRTPNTPNTPGSANPMGGFPQMGGQTRNYPMMPTNNYQQPPAAYRTSSAMMGPAPTAMSHPQPIAPAPVHGRMPQALRPMPTGGLQHLQSSMSAPYGHQTQILSQASMEAEPPTHVVGSQGRRGILPSAPGRPAVTTTGTGTTKNSMVPAKDADGKFPCPHCTKTYLHAKHLKRHLLRHTGDRPYMCVLCRDTFSRSDILKRHFQKCSIRRGNPTGASHLSHAQAHLKKPQPGSQKGPSALPENGLMGVNGMNGLSNEVMQHNFGVIPDGSIPDAASNLTDEHATQDHLSRSNSLKRLGAGVRDPRSMPSGLARTTFDPSYIPSAMSTSMNSYGLPNGHNGPSYNQNYDFTPTTNGANLQPHPADLLQNGRPLQNSFLGSSAGQHGLDWSQMFQPGAQDGFMPYGSSAQIKPEYPQVKPESSMSHNLFNGLYPSNANGLGQPADFSMWNLGSTQSDLFQQISSQLYDFCFPPHSPVGSYNHDMRRNLSADNVKHFLERYANFQGHFPIIHMPSFRITDTGEGLLLAMICIGAVYSDRMTAAEVRRMVEFAEVVVERNSPIFMMVRDQPEGTYENGAIGTGKAELEQIQAVFMMQILSIWHGTPVQREKARQQFPLLVVLARRAGLTQPLTTTPFSVLHQGNVSVEHFNVASFDWNAWVEQEKRSRLLYCIFLVDAAMAIYFNMAPRFDPLEIRLPLPADDAAWDARSLMECADALGLNGPVAARNRNPEGSRRPKQPEMHAALKALMSNAYDLQPGSTNLYSKFVLVHALHVQLWTAQKQLSQGNAQLNGHVSGASTPTGPTDWMMRSMDPGSGANSSNTSGRATPVESGAQSPHTHQILQAINSAFDKWKKAWDEDMSLQYPSPSVGYRRFGFCRDGVHFYWLAKYLMKNHRPSDWQLAPDQRFTHVMHLLKSVKSWVVSDSAKRGEELGSVNDIDKDYGVTDLTLDMAHLFKPINKKTDSPVQGVQTNIGSNGMI